MDAECRGVMEEGFLVIEPGLDHRHALGTVAQCLVLDLDPGAGPIEPLRGAVIRIPVVQHVVHEAQFSYIANGPDDDHC